MPFIFEIQKKYRQKLVGRHYVILNRLSFCSIVQLFLKMALEILKSIPELFTMNCNFIRVYSWYLFENYAIHSGRGLFPLDISFVSMLDPEQCFTDVEQELMIFHMEDFISQILCLQNLGVMLKWDDEKLKWIMTSTAVNLNRQLFYGNAIQINEEMVTIFFDKNFKKVIFIPNLKSYALLYGPICCLEENEGAINCTICDVDYGIFGDLDVKISNIGADVGREGINYGIFKCVFVPKIQCSSAVVDFTVQTCSNITSSDVTAVMTTEIKHSLPLKPNLIETLPSQPTYRNQHIMNPSSEIIEVDLPSIKENKKHRVGIGKNRVVEKWAHVNGNSDFIEDLRLRSRLDGKDDVEHKRKKKKKDSTLAVPVVEKTPAVFIEPFSIDLTSVINHRLRRLSRECRSIVTTTSFTLMRQDAKVESVARENFKTWFDDKCTVNQLESFSLLTDTTASLDSTLRKHSDYEDHPDIGMRGKGHPTIRFRLLISDLSVVECYGVHNLRLKTFELNRAFIEPCLNQSKVVHLFLYILVRHFLLMKGTMLGDRNKNDHITIKCAFLFESDCKIIKQFGKTLWSELTADQLGFNETKALKIFRYVGEPSIVITNSFF
jgi:hypothetical protein